MAVRARRLVLLAVVCVFAGCSRSAGQASTSTSTSSAPAITGAVVSVIPSTQISDAVTWTVTNDSRRPTVATCQVLVLNGHTQLGEYGPVELTVAGSATAQEFSQVDTLSGSSSGDTAQIVCSKG